MNKVAMVTGAGRGIGLELCRQLAQRNYLVVACPRRNEKIEWIEQAEIDGGRAHLVPMDVRDDSSVAAAAGAIARRVKRIDVLFNNAGIYPDQERGLETLEMQDLGDAFDVNAVGPLRVIRSVLPLLRKGKERRLIQITSLMGSIQDNSSGGSYAYRISKTALNMAVKNLANEFGPEGFLCLALHPGWVRTRMGGPSAPTEVGAAVEEILRIALSAGPSENGSFLGPGGKHLPY